MSTVEENPEQRTSSGRRLGVVATVVALVLVGVYLVFVALQWAHVDATGVSWSRRQELLTGLQALALTAVGALLGTTLQRSATDKAESRARDAESAARRNARDAEKGRALQRAIEARRSAPAVPPTQPDVERGARQATGGDALSELAELAHSYDEDDA